MPEAEKKIEEKEEAPEQLAIEIEDDNQPEVASEPEEKTETPEEKEEKDSMIMARTYNVV